MGEQSHGFGHTDERSRNKHEKVKKRNTKEHDTNTRQCVILKWLKNKHPHALYIIVGTAIT